MAFHYPKNKAFGYTISCTSAIIWGTEGVLAKLCYGSGFSVAGLLSMRYILAALTVLLMVRLFRAPLLPPKHLRPKMLAIALVTTLNTFCLYMALNYLPPTLAILFFYAYPAFTTLLCAATGRQPFRLPQVMALLLSAGGLLLLYWSSLGEIMIIGVLFALLAASGQAIKLTYSKSLLAEMDIWTFNFSLTVVAMLGYNIYAMLGFGGGYTLAAVPQGWLYLLILGAVITVCGNLFMFMGVDLIGAVNNAIVSLLEPPTTALLAFLVFGDLLMGWQVFGGVLILLAVALPPLAELRPRRRTGKEVPGDDETPTAMLR